jgi:tetratricopeptide (TPR) repeat protein
LQTSQTGSGNGQTTGQGKFVAQGRNNIINGSGNIVINGDGNNLGPRAAEIAEIFKKTLQEKYPDAAFPSTLQALGPAVEWEQSIAQGDPRMKRALESAKEGNIKAALPLFEAIASDEAARSERATEQAKQAKERDKKHREDTATAFGYLGVFASLSDPQRALKAYKRALEYNPDDLVSLVGSGMIRQVSHGDLDIAKAALEHALDLAKKEDQADNVFCAQLCLGDIEKQHGKFSDALEYYQNGLATAREQLTKAGPWNARWKFYVGIANESLGDLEMGKEKPDYPAAQKFYQARYETISSLATFDKGNPVWQRDLQSSEDWQCPEGTGRP